MRFEKARWITIGQQCENEYNDFIDIFNLKNYNKTVINISAETNYELYINGEFVSSGQYHDYREHKIHDEIDITCFCKFGKNKLAIIGYSQRAESSCYTNKNLGIIYEVCCDGTIVVSSGENTLGRRSIDYISGDMDMITGQIGFTFSYDNTKYDGWKDANYIPKTFTKADILADKVALYLRPIEKLTLKGGEARIVSQGVFKFLDTNPTLSETLQKAYISYRHPLEVFGSVDKNVFPKNKPTIMQADGNVYMIIDLAEECSGYFTLDVFVKKNCQMYVAFGEHLEDMRVRSYISGRCFSFDISLKKGRNVFTNYMRRLGLRYLMVYAETEYIELNNINIIRSEYPLRINTPNFTKPLWNRIYNVAVNTLKVCMHEHYEDTPWREQSLYAMDSRTQMLCGYYAFNEYNFAKASLNLLAQSLREDNLISLCAPMTRQTDRLSIMSFSLIYFVQLYEYLKYSGDGEFFKETVEKVKCVIDNFIGRIEPNGLITNFCKREHWNFYEWTDGLDGNFDIVPDKRYECPLNAFFSLALKALSCGYELLGDKIEAKRYGELANKLNKAIDKVFYDDEKKCYCSFYESDGAKHHCAELTQSLVLCCGAAPLYRKKILAQSLIEGNDWVKTSLSHSIFKYDALLLKNDEQCDRFIIDDIERLWGQMLYNGATSFWETIDGANAFNLAGSLSHGWSAVPIYVFNKIKERKNVY